MLADNAARRRRQRFSRFESGKGLCSRMRRTSSLSVVLVQWQRQARSASKEEGRAHKCLRAPFFLRFSFFSPASTCVS